MMRTAISPRLATSTRFSTFPSRQSFFTRKSGCPYSTFCSLETSTASISQSNSAVISFIIFIASRMQTVSPAFTLSPTFT